MDYSKTTSSLDLTHYYRDQCNLSIIPIKTDGTKSPVCKWERLQNEKLTDVELQEFFGNGIERGIGIVCGSISGNLEIIDIDDPDTGKKWGETVKQNGGTDLLAELPLVRTPSGGWHVYYRCQTIENNQKLALRLIEPKKIKTLIETRGSGGYILAPGCPAACHESGREYKLQRGNLSSIPEITNEERDLLISCARQLNEYIVPDDIVSGHTSTSNKTGTRPGDIFNQQATWDEILIPHGWKQVKQGYWQKPGDNGRGHHATTDHVNSDLLYNFSTAAYPFTGGKAYSKFSAYTLLNHGGDYSVAAKTLADKGYGISSSIESVQKVEQINWTNPDSFGEMLPFDELEGRPISTDFLPSWVKDYVDAVAAHTQVEPGAVAVLALAVLAACVQMRFEVAISSGYTEILSLWVFLALPPASRKSALLQALMAPVIEWEQEEAQRLRPDIEKEQTEIAVIKEQISVLIRLAGKSEE